jgi:RimJ/RimL family protein N-acetyltransferase
MNEVRNYKTNKLATLVLVDIDFKLSEKQLSEIEKIFNQTGVKPIFGQKLMAKRITKDFIEDFLNHYKSGFKENKLYLFLIIEGNIVVGGIDLQVVDDEAATVGFWQDNKVSGYMTNSLVAVCKIAHEYGFKILDGYVEKENHYATKVLVRAGFDYLGEVQGRTKVLQKYVFVL